MKHYNDLDKLRRELRKYVNQVDINYVTGLSVIKFISNTLCTIAFILAIIFSIHGIVHKNIAEVLIFIGISLIINTVVRVTKNLFVKENSYAKYAIIENEFSVYIKENNIEEWKHKTILYDLLREFNITVKNKEGK